MSNNAGDLNAESQDDNQQTKAESSESDSKDKLETKESSDLTDSGPTEESKSTGESDGNDNPDPSVKENAESKEDSAKSGEETEHKEQSKSTQNGSPFVLTSQGPQPLSSQTTAPAPLAYPSPNPSANPSPREPNEAFYHVTLFLGQLPSHMFEEGIRSLFAPYGFLEVKVLRDRITGNHKGAAFVVVRSLEHAQTAVAVLHNRHILPPAKHPLQVKIADGELDRLNHRLIVAHVPLTHTEPQLRQLLEQYGPLQAFDFHTTPDGHFKGSAIVQYQTDAAAQAAIQHLNNHRLDPTNAPHLALLVKWVDAPVKPYVPTMAMSSQAYSNPAAYSNPSAAYNYSNPAAYSYSNPAAYGAYSNGADYGAYANPGAYSYGGYGGYGYGATAAPSAAGSTAGSNPYASYGYGPMRPVKGLEGPPGSNLFVFQLPMQYSDVDLMREFAPFGNILSAEICRDKPTGLSKQFGFVHFDNPESAMNAMTTLNAMVHRQIRVSLKKGSPGGPMPNRGNQPY